MAHSLFFFSSFDEPKAHASKGLSQGKSKWPLEAHGCLQNAACKASIILAFQISPMPLTRK